METSSFCVTTESSSATEMPWLGRTIKRVILALSWREAKLCDMSYAAIYVALTHVKQGKDIRLLLSGRYTTMGNRVLHYSAGTRSFVGVVFQVLWTCGSLGWCKKVQPKDCRMLLLDGRIQVEVSQVNDDAADNSAFAFHVLYIVTQFLHAQMVLSVVFRWCHLPFL
jgi:hypothetical protein